MDLSKVSNEKLRSMFEANIGLLNLRDLSEIKDRRNEYTERIAYMAQELQKRNQLLNTTDKQPTEPINETKNKSIKKTTNIEPILECSQNKKITTEEIVGNYINMSSTWNIVYSSEILIECYIHPSDRIYQTKITDQFFENNITCPTPEILCNFLKNALRMENIQGINVELIFNEQNIIIKINSLIDSFNIVLQYVDNIVYSVPFENTICDKKEIDILQNTNEINILNDTLNNYNTEQLNWIWQLVNMIDNTLPELAEFTGTSKTSIKKYVKMIIERNYNFDGIKKLLSFTINKKYLCRGKQCHHYFMTNDDVLILSAKEHNYQNIYNILIIIFNIISKKIKLYILNVQYVKIIQ